MEPTGMKPKLAAILMADVVVAEVEGAPRYARAPVPMAAATASRAAGRRDRSILISERKAVPNGM